MLVVQGVVNGRIGNVKTEASANEIPLDYAFAQVLLGWRKKNPQLSVGLVFKSPITGGCYHASTNQQNYLRRAADALGLTRLGWHTFRPTTEEY